MSESISWLKEAIEHIQETTQPLTATINGHDYVINHEGEVTEFLPDLFYPDTLELNSLDALVKLVTTEALRSTDAPIYITVPDHLTVRCFRQPDAEKRYFRQVFYEVNATDVPGWESGARFSFEEMQIAMRTRFQESVDSEYVMKLLSDISTGAKITFNDNGVATTVVTSKGVALQNATQIKPIVTLKPYRTFQEIEQPESTFLIRISERGISFTEADGGMWKLKARETIKAFLEDKLSAADNIIIAL